MAWSINNSTSDIVTDGISQRSWGLIPSSLSATTFAAALTAADDEVQNYSNGGWRLFFPERLQLLSGPPLLRGSFAVAIPSRCLHHVDAAADGLCRLSEADESVSVAHRIEPERSGASPPRRVAVIAEQRGGR